MPLKVFIYSKDTRNPSVPKNVRHVKLHPSVKEIRDYAFVERWSLVEVEFSEGLEVIGYDCFRNCRLLKNAVPGAYTHLRAHETVLDLVCRLLLEKRKLS